MIRKAIIVLCLLIVLATALVWVASPGDVLPHVPSFDDDFVFHWDTHKYLRIASYNGWLRIGAIRWTTPSRGSMADDDMWWAFTNATLIPPPFMAPGSGIRHTPPFDMVRTLNIKGPPLHIAAVALPHWLVCVISLVYPVIAFIRGPLRRFRRRRRGLCIRCGYDLEGNVTGVCPECGTPISEDTGAPA